MRVEVIGRMEDEDFGYTRRDLQVLGKVLSVDKEEEEGSGVVVNDGGGGRAGGGGGGTSTAATTAAAAAGNEDRRRPGRASSDPSVAPSTPNIPNVVEYHLKVKSTSGQKVGRTGNTQREERNDEMKKEKSTGCSTDKKKELVSKLSRLSIDNNVFEGSTDLPQVFQVKYLGSHDARGLWGIKHTRRPVDNMVTAAKSLPTNTMLPLIKLVVSQDGVALLPLDKRKQETEALRVYPIESISYGVQDLVYTRVFSMIVVRDTDDFRRVTPFECHGFVCESKHHARQLTYALATAFEIYSRTVKAQDKIAEARSTRETRKRFAIDLRSPDEIEADLTLDSEA